MSIALWVGKRLFLNLSTLCGMLLFVRIFVNVYYTHCILVSFIIVVKSNKLYVSYID